jgi:hypothetical protein
MKHLFKTLKDFFEDFFKILEKYFPKKITKVVEK